MAFGRDLKAGDLCVAKKKMLCFLVRTSESESIRDSIFIKPGDSFMITRGVVDTDINTVKYRFIHVLYGERKYSIAFAKARISDYIDKVSVE